MNFIPSYIEDVVNKKKERVPLLHQRSNRFPTTLPPIYPINKNV